jgi:hypothetical protein
MKVRESQPIAGQLVQVRCTDLSAEAGEITEAQIIRNNDQEVGALGGVAGSASGCV